MLVVQFAMQVSTAVTNPPCFLEGCVGRGWDFSKYTTKVIIHNHSSNKDVKPCSYLVLHSLVQALLL